MIYLANLFSQLFYFVISIGLVGFIIYLLNVLFYRLVGNGRVVCYASGLIGTPIHELSHALMCLIFRHKIEEIKLYQMDDSSGTMGYVSHSYNTKSFYQRIGCFFIGVAPIIGGSLVIHLLMWLLLPEAYRDINIYLDDFSLLLKDGFSFDIFIYSFAVMTESLETIFTSFDKGLYCVVFLLLGACIALHMKLSGADIKNALPAIPSIVLIIVAINVVFAIISIFSMKTYYLICSAVNSVGVYLFALLLLSLCLTLICIAIAFVIKGIKLIVGAILRR